MASKEIGIEREAYKVQATLYPGNSDQVSQYVLFMSMAGCTMKDPASGARYQCDTNLGNGTPIITSMQTGRKVTFSWASLIDVARAIGIDEVDNAFEGR